MRITYEAANSIYLVPEPESSPMLKTKAIHQCCKPRWFLPFVIYHSAFNIYNSWKSLKIAQLDSISQDIDLYRCSRFLKWSEKQNNTINTHRNKGNRPDLASRKLQESMRWYEDMPWYAMICTWMHLLWHRLQSQDQNVCLLLIWNAHHKPLEESEEDDAVDPHKLQDLTFQCALLKPVKHFDRTKPKTSNTKGFSHGHKHQRIVSVWCQVLQRPKKWSDRKSVKLMWNSQFGKCLLPFGYPFGSIQFCSRFSRLN